VCSASSLCACDAACGGAIRGYRNPARERGAGAARAPNPTPRSPGDQGGKHSARAHPRCTLPHIYAIAYLRVHSRAVSSYRWRSFL
jgi:hypothetical protein